MNHICSHLRAHGQNNADFRAMVGVPGIGKLGEHLKCSYGLFLSFKHGKIISILC